MKPINLAKAAILSLALSAGPAAADTAATKKIVGEAMNELMVEENVGAIDTYFAEPYIQHNQSVPSGLAGLKGLAETAIAANPTFKYKMVRLFADGDIGVVHGVYDGFGPTPLVAFDIFRVENGKIVEHWDNLSPVAENNPSGRSQVDGPTEIKELDKTKENKALVADFVNNVLVAGDFSKLPAFIDGENYHQHNSMIADGLTGLVEGFRALAEAGVILKINKLHAIYGEGNFVLAVSEGTVSDEPTAFYDLFRVENGKIAEHWDVIAPILPEEKAANSNGKF